MDTSVSTADALEQWETIIEAVGEHCPVQTVDYRVYDERLDDAFTAYPDGVFCANHALRVPGERQFVRSRMASPQRRGEPAYFDAWAADTGYDILSTDGVFEGAGDGKWHIGSDILWLGYGQRTSRQAVAEITRLLDARVIPLRLVSPAYYHLDTCFTRLGPDSVLIVPEAFTRAGRRVIQSVFDTVHTVPTADRDSLGGNACLLNASTVALDATNTATATLLNQLGYTVVSLDSSAFRAAGGSIDCLTLPLDTLA